MRVSRRSFDPSVYLVTDRRTASGRSVQHVVAQVVATAQNARQVTFVQLRDKNVPRAQSIELGTQLRRITERADVAFVVNDDIQLAALLGADGVHLGQDDQSVSVARQRLGNNAIVGVSAATEQEIDAAIADGADYIGVGSVFPTSSKPDAGEPLGERRLRQLVRYTSSRIPLVAIGGINVDNAVLCKRAGADGVAVISAIMASPQPALAAQQLASIMTNRHVPTMSRNHEAESV
ncbi:thiamine phosphate synthase [Gracilaria domingensis]|nr:thiamine phosphate synthase [Gracilaria domingensis]